MNSTFRGLLILIPLAAFFLYVHYEPYLSDPNHTYFNIYGDGYKNYFTLVYHVKHDSTYSHFEGMNYPRGEHVLFTDGQVALGNTLRFISRNVIDISDHTVGIMHYAIALSFLIGAVFLYLTFLRLGLPVWFSVLAALGMMLMSPQHFRPIAHYSLSYGCFVPGALYLLLRFEEKPSWRISGWMSAWLFVAALIHLYYFGIAALLLAAYFAVSWWRARAVATARTLALHFALQAILPYALVQGWLFFTDPVTDRPATPVGFLNYHAYWEGILTAVQTPLWRWIDQNWVDIRDMTFESESYIGLVGGIGFFAFLPRLFKGVRGMPGTGVAPLFTGKLFPAVFFLLLLSLGLPFIIPGLEFLVDYLGPFRQFRAQGRFAWGFYYGWGLIVWYLIYHWGKNGAPIRRRLGWGLAFAVLAYESYGIQQGSLIKPWKEPRFDRAAFEASPGYWFKNINLNDYQAVLPMPFFLIGSENLNIDAPGDAVRFATLPGWLYGMQTLGVNLSRSSYSETLKRAPLELLPYRPYAILDDLPNKKPLLVVLDKGQYFNEFHGSAYLLRDTKVLFEDDKVQLREIPLEAFDRAVALWRADIQSGWEGALKNGVQRDGYWLSDNAFRFLHQTFDDRPSPKSYQGGGAFSAPVGMMVPFAEFKAPAARNKLSAWVYMGEDQYPRLNFRGYEVLPDGKKKQVAHNGSRFDVVVFDQNGWGLVEFELNVSAPDVPVQLFLECKEIHVPREVYVDELLVRADNGNMFWQRPGWLVFNNLWFPN